MSGRRTKPRGKTPVHCRRNRRPSRRAFSLVELLTVLVLIGALSVMALPRFAGFRAKRQVDAAARRIAADLNLARRRAMLTDTTQRVTFDLSNNRYTLDAMSDLSHAAQGYAVDLSGEPYGVRLTYADFTSSSESAGDRAVVFDNYGQPDSEGWAAVEAGSETLWVTLHPETGRTSISTTKPLKAP